MNSLTVKLLQTVLLLVCIIMMVAINNIPRGNFIAAPFITGIIYTPLMIVQVISTITTLLEDEPAKMGKRFWLSVIITIVFVSFFFRFLLYTT